MDAHFQLSAIQNQSGLQTGNVKPPSPETGVSLQLISQMACLSVLRFALARLLWVSSHCGRYPY